MAFPEDLAAAGAVSSDQDGAKPVALRKSHWRGHLWLAVHAGLLVLTLLTTSLVGARMQRDFRLNAPLFGLDEVWSLYSPAYITVDNVVSGFPFSLTLLAILLFHELGHYLACRRYGLDASLPYFLPAPVLIGTFGAFIRIRSAIYSRKALFDVAVAGPIAGFVVAVPALLIGLAYSKVIPGIVNAGEFRFGVPPLLWLFQLILFPGEPSTSIYLHPVARAATIGLLATAWNLLPVGQLDGGHLVYAVIGKAHRRISLAMVASLVIFGLVFWRGWLLWAVLLFFLRRHPVIYDTTPLGPARRRLAWIAMAIFLLSFTLAPFEETSGL